MSDNYRPNLISRTSNVREILKGVKYKLDYYQRGYVWRKENILQLLCDLTDSFLSVYEPKHERKMVVQYPNYFLGTIVTIKKGPDFFIIDGQQRLTSLTLLLLHLRNLQEDSKEKQKVNVDKLIYSEAYGIKSFNLNIEERIPIMEALFHNNPFDKIGQPISVVNIRERYTDLQENWPVELSGNALPYFIDWLLECVRIVEIRTESLDSAFKIFVSENDRGLSLS